MAKQTKSSGIRRSPTQWKELLAKQSRSGLTVEAFCRREAISKASFYRWRDVFDATQDHSGEVDAIAPPAFVELGALPPRTSQGSSFHLKLDLGGGLILHLERC